MYKCVHSSTMFAFSRWRASSCDRFLCSAILRPDTTERLLIVDGISERLCDRFGQKLVDCVTAFCRENNVLPNRAGNHPDSQANTFSQYWVRAGLFHTTSWFVHLYFSPRIAVHCQQMTSYEQFQRNTTVFTSSNKLIWTIKIALWFATLN